MTMYRYLIPVFAMLALGCEKVEESQVSTLQPESCEYVVMVAIDMSQSFCKQMAEDGKAYDFMQQVVEKYFRDRIGGNDQIIITQLSGNNRPLLWQGTPFQLRKNFPDKAAFRNFLLANADSDASRINDGIHESLRYLMRTHSVGRGNAKTATLILSDMEDSFDDQDESGKRLISSLTNYAKRGSIGFYYCSQHRMEDIEDKLAEAGITMYMLECDIHGNPPLPSFE